MSTEVAHVNFFDRYAWRIIPEPNSGCWLWFSSQDSNGYGNLRGDDGKTYYAHRKAFESVHGDGSAIGIIVRHKCDNPCCVNPDHLLGGTYRDNYMDAVKRGRVRPVFGSRHPRAILNEQQVYDMRVMAQTVHLAEVARIFGVQFGCAHEIVTGNTWRRVGGVSSKRGKYIQDTRYAEEAPRSKMTNEQVVGIRSRLAAGEKGVDLAREFGVIPATISSIKTRRKWRTI